MRRGVKVGLGALLIGVLATGYGVYWWYEAALDAQVEASQPSDFARDVSSEVRHLLLSAEFKDKGAGLVRLDKLSEEDRAEVLGVMADDPSQTIRMIAIPMMSRLRDRFPRVRALLVRLALNDPEKDVRDAARDALGGGGSP